MKRRFDLLVFDWDGTLYDSIDWIVHCLQACAADCNYPVPSAEAARSIIGLGIREAVDTLFPGIDDALRPRLAERYKYHYAQRPYSAADLFPGITAMLEQLSAEGYLLAIATGKSRNGLEPAMKGTNTTHFFHATRCADETASKPDPLMLLQLIQEFSVQAERTLMIGDAIHDLEMALNAKVPAVAVTCGANDHATLTRYQPMACLAQPSELLNLLA